jgi:hypothetical protein
MIIYGLLNETCVSRDMTSDSELSPYTSCTESCQKSYYVSTIQSKISPVNLYGHAVAFITKHLRGCARGLGHTRHLPDAAAQFLYI